MQQYHTSCTYKSAAHVAVDLQCWTLGFEYNKYNILNSCMVWCSEYVYMLPHCISMAMI